MDIENSSVVSTDPQPTAETVLPQNMQPSLLPDSEISSTSETHQEIAVSDVDTQKKNEKNIFAVKASKRDLFYFVAGNSFQTNVGDQVVIGQKDRSFFSIGTVVSTLTQETFVDYRGLYIQRVVRSRDAEKSDKLVSREEYAFKFCARKASELNLPMKLLKVNFEANNAKATFYFFAENRIDFRELVKILAHEFRTRIEMRQVGVRDQAKIVGALGVCGQETCCSRFITKFEPISIKMAKDQNLALNHQRLLGQCGRLKCCLAYEQEAYVELRKEFPRVGADIQTPKGKALLKENLLIQKLILAFFPETSTQEYFPLHEITFDSSAKSTEEDLEIDYIINLLKDSDNDAEIESIIAEETDENKRKKILQFQKMAGRINREKKDSLRKGSRSRRNNNDSDSDNKNSPRHLDNNNREQRNFEKNYDTHTTRPKRYDNDGTQSNEKNQLSQFSPSEQKNQPDTSPNASPNTSIESKPPELKDEKEKP